MEYSLGSYCPLKTKNFMWTACSNILSTAESLKRRRVLSNDTCAFRNEPKTLENVLLCEWSRAVFLAICGMHIQKEAI